MLVIKSFLYSLYFLKFTIKNYFPVFLYLVFTQTLVIYTKNIFLVLIFFVGYIIISSPITINIFRNIITADEIINSFTYFIDKDYTKLYIKKALYLLSSIIIIYIIHVIVLSPFFPNEISKMTIYLYILFIYMLYIYSRVMFILPAAAINKSWGLKDSYLKSKDKSIKIYLLYLTLIIPYVLINFSITNFSENSDIKVFFVFLAMFMQLFFTILNSTLIGYIYKDYIKNISK